MYKRLRLYFARVAVFAMVPAAALKAEILNIGLIGGQYMLVEASGPTRSNPENFSLQDGANTVSGSVFCREDMAIGTSFPGTLQNFTVDTTSRRVSFVLDGEPVSFTAPFLHTAGASRDGVILKGDVVIEDTENPDPAVRIEYRTDASVYFATFRAGDELTARMVETTTYFYKNQPVLDCREVYQISGYVNPRKTLSDRPYTIIDFMKGKIRNMVVDPNSRNTGSGKLTAIGVRG